MEEEKNIPSEQEIEEYNKMVNSNTILLSFEGWIKYIEGFTRGLQTTKTVDANSVMDCIGEVLEYMTQLRTQVMDILIHCENVLEENEQLKLLLEQISTPKLQGPVEEVVEEVIDKIPEEEIEEEEE